MYAIRSYYDINSVRIESDKSTGKCRESMAKLIPRSDDDTGLIDEDYLFVMVEDYAILEWTSALLTARAKPRAADFVITSYSIHYTKLYDECKPDGSYFDHLQLWLR